MSFPAPERPLPLQLATAWNTVYLPMLNPGSTAHRIPFSDNYGDRYDGTPLPDNFVITFRFARGGEPTPLVDITPVKDAADGEQLVKVAYLYRFPGEGVQTRHDALFAHDALRQVFIWLRRNLPELLAKSADHYLPSFTKE